MSSPPAHSKAPITRSITPGVHVIEASAGTGKTFHLSFLFVRLHLQNRIELEKLCAITFTNLATAELRQRIKDLFTQIRDEIQSNQQSKAQKNSTLAPTIKQWLNEQFERSQHEQLIKDCSFALLYLHHAKIKTIHSFFQILLKRYYLYADIDSQFEIIAEDSEWKKNTKIWAKEFWLKKNNSKSEEFSQEQHVFKHFYKKPENLSNSIPTNSTGRAIAAELIPPDWNYITSIIDNKGPTSKDYKTCATIVKHYYKNEFLAYINHKTEQLIQSGSLNYNLILQLTLTASKNPFFCSHVRKDFCAILIDEFQDTDYIQWNVIKNIFLQESNMRNIVCLIGDPKQSIYRFRSADIDCYFEAIHSADSKENLALNWRSDKQLLDVLNKIYQGCSLEPTAFEHSNLHYIPVQAPPSKNSHHSSVLFSDSQTEMIDNALFIRAPENIERVVKAISEEQMLKWLLQDCLQLCSSIQQQKVYIQNDVNSPRKQLEYSDILILCRSNDSIITISQMLQQHKIPIAREIKIEIWQSKAAQRVITLLQLLHSKNEAQNLSQNDVIAISIILGNIDFENADSQVVHNKIANVFLQWHNVLSNHGPLRLWHNILTHRCYGAFHLNIHQLENHINEITQLFEKLQLWWKEGITRIQDWLIKIQDNIQLAESYLNQDNAIRIMTVHRAKGLEAPIVICPDLWNGGVNRLNEFTDYLDYSAEKQHYTVQKEANSVAKKIENHRLLYVALTRARSKMILYWMPYKQRSKNACSLETLLFNSSKEGELNEKENLERLSKIRHLRVLTADSKLLENIPLNYSKNRKKTSSQTAKVNDENNNKNLTQKINSGLWSFSRIYRTNTKYQPIHDEYEKDKELEDSLQYEKEKTIKNQILKANSSREKSTYFNSSQLGTLVHKIIQNVLEKNPSIDEQKLPTYIVQESNDLLKKNTLKQKNTEEIQSLIESLSDSTLRSVLRGTSTSLEIQGGESFALYSSYWRKYCEMRFDIKINQWQIEKLNEIRIKYPQIPLAPLNALTIENTLFSGFIDLVLISKEGISSNPPIIWIVDFKTNFLGTEAKDYGKEQIEQSMLDNYYGWQALFYAFSIYSWLKSIQVADQSPNIQIAYLYSRGLQLAQETIKSTQLSQTGQYIFDLPEGVLEEIHEILNQTTKVRK